ncbi:hypothetical protein VP01_951g3 [Puccinia sorghi]|uniref:Uncharacterized protein n=1 Tax=Puccinia sorghi TaxID=27349 RepID=A0A0L6U6D1_9BASI|nr:hypothetical protein VP01_951g3 [Puccinia sorghi]
MWSLNGSLAGACCIVSQIIPNTSSISTINFLNVSIACPVTLLHVIVADSSTMLQFSVADTSTNLHVSVSYTSNTLQVSIADTQDMLQMIHKIHYSISCTLRGSTNELCSSCFIFCFSKSCSVSCQRLVLMTSPKDCVICFSLFAEWQTNHSATFLSCQAVEPTMSFFNYLLGIFDMESSDHVITLYMCEPNPESMFSVHDEARFNIIKYVLCFHIPLHPLSSTFHQWLQLCDSCLIISSLKNAVHQSKKILEQCTGFFKMPHCCFREHKYSQKHRFLLVEFNHSGKVDALQHAMRRAHSNFQSLFELSRTSFPSMNPHFDVLAPLEPHDADRDHLFKVICFFLSHIGMRVRIKSMLVQDFRRKILKCGHSWCNKAGQGRRRYMTTGMGSVAFFRVDNHLCCNITYEIKIAVT